MISRAFHLSLISDQNCRIAARPNKNSENYGAVINGLGKFPDNPEIDFSKIILVLKISRMLISEKRTFQQKITEFPEGKSNGTEIPSKKVSKMSV